MNDLLAVEANMKEKELLALMVKNARLAGTYKGLLEALMCQSTKKGDTYVVSAAAFDKVRKAVDDLDAPI